jgi:PIN domain nuclease of toxin-antitoxin system
MILNGGSRCPRMKSKHFWMGPGLKPRVLPCTSDHVYDHSDPFDRQIIAQALAESIPIVTSDEKFRLYKGLAVIW